MVSQEHSREEKKTKIVADSVVQCAHLLNLHLIEFPSYGDHAWLWFSIWCNNITHLFVSSIIIYLKSSTSTNCTPKNSCSSRPLISQVSKSCFQNWNENVNRYSRTKWIIIAFSKNKVKIIKLKIFTTECPNQKLGGLERATLNIPCFIKSLLPKQPSFIMPISNSNHLF